MAVKNILCVLALMLLFVLMHRANWSMRCALLALAVVLVYMIGQ